MSLVADILRSGDRAQQARGQYLSSFSSVTNNLCTVSPFVAVVAYLWEHVLCLSVYNRLYFYFAIIFEAEKITNLQWFSIHYNNFIVFLCITVLKHSAKQE